MVRVGCEPQVVDGDVAALTDELEGDSAADARCAAGYGGCFAGEETPVGRCHLLGSRWWDER